MKCFVSLITGFAIGALAGIFDARIVQQGYAQQLSGDGELYLRVSVYKADLAQMSANLTEKFEEIEERVSKCEKK